MDFDGISFKEVKEQEWKGNVYHDYIFTASGDTYEQLMDYFMEMCMKGIGGIRYGKEDKLIGVECIFPFNRVTKTENLPIGLKGKLDELVSKIK